jgi:hypothetical protein
MTGSVILLLIRPIADLKSAKNLYDSRRLVYIKEKGGALCLKRS